MIISRNALSWRGTTTETDANQDNNVDMDYAHSPHCTVQADLCRGDITYSHGFPASLLISNH